MKYQFIACMLLMPLVLRAQYPDTLSFYSEVFEEEREVFVYAPFDLQYASESLVFPVIYVLDGQHEWYAEPVLNDIHYLQYTHEMPDAIVVVIPHSNRVSECSVPENVQDPTPLMSFITGELEGRMESYRPGDWRLIIGHSLCASYALYAGIKEAERIRAVIAHSPYYPFPELIEELSKDGSDNDPQLAVSIGSPKATKDKYHRDVYESTKKAYPALFNSIHTFESEYASHNAVPLVANAPLLTEIFHPFSIRFSDIAVVDANYSLVQDPGAIAQELAHIQEASVIGTESYPPEIAEINGIASRYLNSGFTEHARAVYEEGIKHYPGYFEFYLTLYDLCVETNPDEARLYLDMAEEMVHRHEQSAPDYEELISAIEDERRQQGW